MNCTEIRKDIELYVLDGLDEVRIRQVEAHLHRCVTCHQLEQEYRLSLVEFKNQAKRDMPSNISLIGRICEAVQPSLRQARGHVRFRRFVSAAASVAAAVVLTASVWYGWVGRGGDRARPLATRSKTTFAPIRTIWQNANSANVSMSDAYDIVVHGKMVFFVSEHGDKHGVNAVDAASGKTLWHSDLPSCGYLAADNDLVYCVASTSQAKVELAALNRLSGQIIWTFDKVEPSYGPYGASRPAVMSRNRVCWVYEDGVYALDARTGGELWHQKFDNEACLSPAVVIGQSVYVASGNGIYCIDGNNGHIDWHLPCDCHLWPGTKPLIAAGPNRLFAATASKNGKSSIRCIDITTRRFIWEKSVPRVTHLRADSTHLYLRCQRVLALDQSSGNPVWDVNATGCSPITAYDDMICFVDSTREGRLMAVNRYTGHTAWQIPGLHSCSSFVKVGGRGYLNTNDRVVLAFSFGS